MALARYVVLVEPLASMGLLRGRRPPGAHLQRILLEPLD
jgi:hypothetical protein